MLINRLHAQFTIDRRVVARVIVLFLIIESVLFYTIFIKNEPLLTAAVLATLVITFLIFRFPEFGALLAITMVFSAVSATYLGGLFKVLILLTLVSFLAMLLYRNASLVSDPLNTLVLPLTVIASISLLYVEDFQLGVESFFEYIKAVVLFVLVTNLLRTKEIMRITFWVIVLSGMYISTVNLYGLIKDPLSFALRLGWPFDDPNNLALVLVSIVPFAYALTRSEKGISKRMVAFFCGTTIAVAILPTLSRGGILALIIVMAYILYKERKQRIILYSFLGIIGISILIFYSTFSLGLELVMDRFGGIDKSFLQRYRVLQGAIAMFLDNPILGVGIGNFLVYSTAYTKLTTSLYAHNMFIHMAAELGIFAICLFVGILVMAFRRLLRIEKNAIERNDVVLLFQSRGAQVSLLAVIVCGLFLSQQFNKILWILLGLSISLTQIARNELRLSRQK